MQSKLKSFWKSLGPGFITGASDDDPSAIVTYTVAGAKFGPSSLWTMLYTLPIMIVLQEMSARIGISSSCGLAGNIKRYYSKRLLIFISTLIITANTFNIGADVFGMAAAIELLLPGPAKLWSPIIILVMLFLIIKLSYKKIVMIFKWLAFSLLTYIVAGLFFIENWPSILRSTLLPPIRFDKEYLGIIVAVFGTTIAPYLAFWQASEEAEEKRLERGEEDGPFVCKFRIVTKNELRRTVEDTRVGMVFSNLVGFFIIALTSSVIFKAGIHNIETIEDAAGALQPLAGQYAYLLFALGIIGSGLLAIPILAGSSAYALSEVFNWKASLNKSFSKAKEFYMIIIIATGLGLLIPYFGIGPIKALFWTAIIHGSIAPILIGILLHMANNPAIVGPNVNKPATNFFGYVALIVMILISIIFVISNIYFP